MRQVWKVLQVKLQTLFGTFLKWKSYVLDTILNISISTSVNNPDTERLIAQERLTEREMRFNALKVKLSEKETGNNAKNEKIQELTIDKENLNDQLKNRTEKIEHIE